jgi:tetratricopeptide (TPR) repeat protein
VEGRAGPGAALAVVLLLGSALAVAWIARERALPADPAAAARRGLALYDQGRFAEAAAAFEESLSRAEDAGTRTNLANALRRLGRSDEAFDEYLRALQRDPRVAQAWYGLGNLLRDDRRDLHSAVDAWRRAIEADPRYAEAHANLGAALLDLGDAAGAAAELEAALSLAPESSPWRADAERRAALARFRAREAR